MHHMKNSEDKVVFVGVMKNCRELVKLQIYSLSTCKFSAERPIRLNSVTY